MKKYNYTAKTFEEAKNMALADLMDTQENLYIKEIESTNKLFSKKSVIEVIKRDDVIEHIKEMIKEMTHLMGVEIKLECKKREDNVTFTIFSDNNAILIGKNARTLDAMTTIIKQALNVELGEYFKFVLDVSEYKEKQHRFIERAAKQTAKEVVRTQVEAKLEPMNSFERRLVHNALTNFKGVYTESVGTEPHRCVVIKPGEKKENETTEE